MVTACGGQKYLVEDGERLADKTPEDRYSGGITVMTSITKFILSGYMPFIYPHIMFVFCGIILGYYPTARWHVEY